MSLPEMERSLYTALIGLVGLGRLFELSLSRRNTRRALAHGGREYGEEHYPVMVALHAAFLVSCVAEVWLLGRRFLPVLGGVALLLWLGAVALRLWVITTLGERWTTRVVVVPGATAVTGGPFRFLRHPNYLAVVIEILALPLVHTAWITACGFSLANGLLLRRRVAVEEAALAGHTDWGSAFGRRVGKAGEGAE